MALRSWWRSDWHGTAGLANGIPRLPAQDLLGCAEVLIGDETIGIKGISGGQKRRVSVGIELVKVRMPGRAKILKFLLNIFCNKNLL